VVFVVDDLDLRILNLLMDNSKLSYRKLAVRLGVSVATIMNRINKLEKEKIIKKYSAVIDYEKLGYDIAILTEVRIAHGNRIDVEKSISEHPNVRSVFDVTGGVDALVFAIFKNRREMDGFLKRIQSIQSVERTETKLILNTLKDDHIRIG